MKPGKRSINVVVPPQSPEDIAKVLVEDTARSAEII
jgi:hypothetical protein